VNARSLRVASTDEGESWAFSYKSQGPYSTTGKRWRGYVKFLKENVSANENAEDLDCKIYCNCPDYIYRYAYNNYKAGAGDLGRNNGQPPRPRSQGGVGDYGTAACKHLISLGKYLKTKIEPNAPEAEDEAPVPHKKVNKQILPPSKLPQTSKAPSPDDSYTDSRSGSDTLMEGRSLLYERIEQFVKSNPEFDVPCEE